jgi:hypothetical protein
MAYSRQIRNAFLNIMVTGDLMLFDVRGDAVYPTCGARYRRTLNVIAHVE